jgi:glutamine synthetase
VAACCSTSEELLCFLENDGKNIQFINLLFPDILGELRGFDIPSYELENALKEGKGFDGSSIEGLVRIEESDLIAFPDVRTFRILPWTYEDHNGCEYKVGCLFCDILNPDHCPNFGDTRRVLKNALANMRQQGYTTCYIGPEIEFFYFDGVQSKKLLDKGDYFSMGIGDPFDYLRKKTALGLLSMGIVTEYGHHEVAPSQHELDLKYNESLYMADSVMLVRYIVKEFARREGLYATFMPKPIDNENGSGMHIHQSLWNGTSNVFFDEKNLYCLSDTAQSYIAGILTHIREITAILNQWVNSYKRLLPGFEAPVYVVWGQKNRSALIRVPEYKPGKEEGTRIELRSPDSGCNPYLAFAVSLAAGLEGIANDYELPKPCEKDIFNMTENERKKISHEVLPKNLEEAVTETQNGSLVKNTLGSHLFNKFIENKKFQIKLYRNEMGHKYDSKVSPFELIHNLPRL